MRTTVLTIHYPKDRDEPAIVLAQCNGVVVVRDAEDMDRRMWAESQIRDGFEAFVNTVYRDYYEAHKVRVPAWHSDFLPMMGATMHSTFGFDYSIHTEDT